MQKVTQHKWYKPILMILLFLGLTTQVIHATSRVDAAQEIDQINNIRKQFTAIVEQGYYNHLDEKSNKGNINQVRVYLDQIPGIEQSLRTKKEGITNKFELRNLNTLLATTLYLKDMGENLIDYLEAKTQQDQYDFFVIHLQSNQFILNILATVENTDY